MEQKELHTLRLTAARVRDLAMDMVHTAASGHIGGSLSVADILTTLYFKVMSVDPAKPRDPDRDRLVLSKGHCTPALYATLALRGYFPTEELKLFRSIEGHMSGHPDMNHVPGVDMSTGSLGQGISAAVGMALAGKQDGKAYRVYAVLGDGEIEEGLICIAAPICDMNGRAVGAVSVSGPDYRMQADQEVMIREVRRTAQSISRLLGYRG